MEHGNVVISCPAGGRACALNVAADGTASYDRTGGMPSVKPAFAAQTLPTGHGLSAGDISVAAGESMEHGNVVISCPAGGNACVLNVGADGTASYDRTGGMPTLMPARRPLDLPARHGLAAGRITIAPGTSEEHGNVLVSCPARGASCVLTVAVDGAASYDTIGGMPTFMPAQQPLELPPGHGLAAGNITIAPGISEEHGNVVVSCPAGGASCALTVAVDGAASYYTTGATPTVMPAQQPLELPPGHGLAAGNITIAPGISEQHGDVVVFCPDGDLSCVIIVAADGTASYYTTGATPTVMPARQPLGLGGHRLAAGRITIAPGTSEQHGDVVVSCPTGDVSCVIIVATDGTASYDTTGGTPTVMPVRQPLELPGGHGLAAGSITIAPGTSEQHGDVVVFCPDGDVSCVLIVAADGTASYDTTGGMPTLILVSSEKLAGEVILPPDLTNYPPSASTAWILGHIRSTAPSSRFREWHFYHPDFRPVPGTTWTLVGLVQSPGAPSSSSMPLSPGMRIYRVYNPDVPGISSSRTYVAENYVGITPYGEFWLSGYNFGAVVRDAFVPADRYDLYYDNEHLRPQWDKEFPADKTIGSWKGVLIATNRTTVYHPREIRSPGEDPFDLIIGSVNVRLRSTPQVFDGFTLDVDFFRIHHFEDPDRKYEDVSLSLEGTAFFGDPVRIVHDGEFIANYHLPVRQDKYIKGRFVGPNGEGVLGEFVTKLYPRGISLPENPREIRQGEHYIWGTGAFGALYTPLPRYFPTDSPEASGLVGVRPVSIAAAEAPVKVFEDLGPWNDAPIHVQDKVGLRDGDVTFGVRLGNGSPEPWFSGPAPSTELGNNQGLSGQVSWSGHLLGLTPATEVVRGNADLTIQLETLEGELGFTSLESWPSGEVSEAVGTGTPWGDGDLQFLVNVQGNTFMGAGGDAGTVTGSFFGDSHEAVSGSVERDDLTAVFGGER
ncbi:MAG: hypothetical protein OXU42_11545 [Deltaproteobacteria bacterium]|nr:hypothetical protein [Deltaproteobacteria bacterium]